MKTVAEFAKEIGKSTTSVYRALNDVEQKAEKCLTVLNGGIKQITDEGLEILRDRFGSVEQSVQQTSNDVERPLNTVEHPKNSEFEALSKKYDDLMSAYIDLTKELTAITKENQIITKQQQAIAMAEKNIAPALLAEAGSGSTPAEVKKRNFLSRIFRRQS